jgi:hypothetical protein
MNYEQSLYFKALLIVDVFKDYPMHCITCNIPPVINIYIEL